MTPFEVRELVSRLAAAYPESPMTDESRDLYARMLSDLPHERTDAIVDELIATSMKLPTISRVRRAVVAPELNIPTADEAWAAIQERQPELHDLVQHVARLMGGLFNMRTSDDPELTRVRFSKVYERLYRAAVDEALAEGIRSARLRLTKAS
jgi:flagellar biosynthesis component FlhA